MPVTIDDFFAKASNGTIPVATTLSAQKASGVTSMTVQDATGWPTDTPIHCLLYTLQSDGKTVTPGSVTVWKGIMSGTTVGSLTLRGGTDTTYAAGSQCILSPTSSQMDDLVAGILAQHKQDGSHSAITADSVVTTGAMTAGGTLTANAGLSATGPIALSGSMDGWVGANEVWAFASATTITVPTDATAKYDVGDLVKLTQSATVKYFVVTGVAATVLTVAGLAGVTIANSAITANAYSKGSNPHGAGLKGGLPYNPYKFSAYRSTALSPTGAVIFDTKEYDTSSNYDTATGKFTAPVAGFYQVSAQLKFATTGTTQNIDIILTKNGVNFKRGSSFVEMYTGASSVNSAVLAPPPFFLAVGDYLQILPINSPTLALDVNAGSAANYFGAWLVSAL